MKQENKYYDSIEDLPVKIYDKINKTNDYNLLIISGEVGEKELYKAWVKINDQIEDLIGVNPTYESFIHHKIKALEHYEAAICKGEKWKLTLAQIEERNAEMIEKEFEVVESLEAKLLKLSKNQGYHINGNKLTVAEYFELIKIHKNG